MKIPKLEADRIHLGELCANIDDRREAEAINAGKKHFRVLTNRKMRRLLLAYLLHTPKVQGGLCTSGRMKRTTSISTIWENNQWKVRKTVNG